MIMLGSGHENEYGGLMKQPDEIGGAETRSAYVIVPDADAHFGRGYTCRDPEGHLWNFGTYSPWQE
jgi:uncharacterized glyoxalase superfamily protein PhnB